MAAPPAFSTYVALSQERQARNVELRRAAVFIAGLLAIALVSLVYLNIRTRVVIRGEEVRLLAVQRTEQVKKNQDLAYRVAWESAPQRLEERARKLRMAPITQWESVAVPGLTDKLKAPGAATTAGLPGADQASGSQAPALSVELVLGKIKSWLGLGLRTPASGSASP